LRNQEGVDCKEEWAEEKLPFLPYPAYPIYLFLSCFF